MPLRVSPDKQPDLVRVDFTEQETCISFDLVFAYKDPGTMEFLRSNACLKKKKIMPLMNTSETEYSCVRVIAKITDLYHVNKALKKIFPNFEERLSPQKSDTDDPETNEESPPILCSNLPSPKIEEFDLSEIT